MSAFKNEVPDSELFRSGSGHGNLHSRGALLYDLTVAAGSAKGLVRLFSSTSASAATMKFFARIPPNTQGNGTYMFRFDPPMPFAKRLRLKRTGGGTGGGASAGIAANRMVVKARFVISKYRATPS